jgi:hypothetical protein
MAEYVTRKDIAKKTGIKKNSLRAKLADLSIWPHHCEPINGRWTSFYNSACIEILKQYMKDKK